MFFSFIELLFVASPSSKTQNTPGPEILQKDFKFSKSGIYYAPSHKLDKEQTLEFIKDLPIQENPEAFWMHQNADLTAKIKEGIACVCNHSGGNTHDMI